MELAFDERKLLVPGVYEVPIEVVQEHFGKAQRSDRRPTLFAKLVEHLDAVKRAGIGASVIVDGSLVMGCVEEPDDIDIVLILPAGWDTKAELKPYQYNLVSRSLAKSIYGLDVLTAETGSSDELGWIEFFGRVNLKWREKFGWSPDARKGILRVLL